MNRADNDPDEEHNRKALNRAAPMGSTFDDLFRSGSSAWLKIGGAALATPLLVLAFLRKQERRGGDNALEDPKTLILTLGLSALVGAFLGASLTLKDVVNERVNRNEPVPFLLEIFFGMGIISVLAVWVPLAFVAAVTVSILTV